MSNQNLIELATKCCSRLINLYEDEATKKSLENLKNYFEDIEPMPEFTMDEERFITKIYEKLLAIDQSPDSAVDEILTSDILSGLEANQPLFTALFNLCSSFDNFHLSTPTIVEVESTKQEPLEELSMNISVETLVDYLLDVETTSEVTFNEELIKNKKLYYKHHLARFKQIIDKKLKQWMDFDQSKRSGNTNDDSDDEPVEDELKNDTQDEGAMRRFEGVQTTEQADQYIDVAGQCQRLLQLLYYSHQHYAYFSDLYFRTIDRCIKSDNEKIVTMALEQIVLHLSERKENDQEEKQLLACLPTDTSSSKLSPEQQEIVEKIQLLSLTSQTGTEPMSIFSSDNLAELYPYKARFLDVRQEFRDSTHYFIDGDSLLLSIAHHINVDLKSYFGNTVHVIYIIERILLRLFTQSNQYNYTLLFFDCHHQLYQNEHAILTLLRACFISHLSKNLDRCRIVQFSSWLDDNYLQFSREEKPMFLFYHDISNFDHHLLLSEETLEKLRISYRLYGNYHQYYIQTHLYLMNKFTLTNTSIECFQIRYTRKCSMELLRKCLTFLSSRVSSTAEKENNKNMELEKAIEDITDADVRLYLYLKTLVQLIENKQVISIVLVFLILDIFHSESASQTSQLTSCTSRCTSHTIISSRSTSAIRFSCDHIQFNIFGIDQ